MKMQNSSNQYDLLNIFTKAAKIAKAQNQYTYNEEINDAVKLELLKQVFPQNKDLINILAVMKNITNAN